MSRRKQARPIRHLDDIDGTEDAANLTAEDGARTSPDDEDDASEAECDEQLEKCDAKRSSDSPSSADGDNEDRVNNNENRTARGRRRKRDEDDDLDELEDASDDQDERVRRPSCGDDDVEDSGENERRARAKKPARDTDVFPSSQPTEEGESGNNGSVNPYHPSLFPYAATLANANVTLDALQNTKMAIAQFAANAMANNGQQSPQALQELAVLQSTLYALQQQQIMQLQLIQQLQQQLQINQPEGGNGTGSNGGKENINLSMFGFGLDGSAAADERERDPSLESSSRTSTPGHVTANQSRGGELNETAEPLPADISKRASELLAASSALLRKEERSGRSENKTDESDRRESKKSPSKTREEGDNNGQSKSSLFPSTSTWSSTTQSTASTSYSFSTASIMSQLPGGSLADTILQASDPPPNPEGPSTLEMLQRTAQQVLNNASQGLLATNLADELGFRTNGNGAGNGASGEGGKKDQLFKHRCRYCGKVFSSDSALQIHIRSHTGERPFKCNICGNRFTTKGNLKVHFQRHAARFPHIKMNPLPVPEHLDKFHPPLLAQLDLDESKMSPSGAPFGPISGSTSAPSNLPSRDNRAPSPTGFLRPNLSGQIPVSVSSFFGRNASASNGSAVPGGDLMPALRPMFPGLSVAGLKEAAASFLSSAAAAAVAGQDLPENLSSKQSSSAIVDNSTDKKESAKSAASSEPDTQQIKTERADQSVDDEMDFDDSAQADRESNHQAETEGENETSAADNKREEMMLSGRNSRTYSHDESSVDSNFSGHEQELADDNINNSRHEDHKDNSLDGPENLSGRRSANSSPASTVNSVSGTAGRGDLPFSPVNFGQFGPPGGPLRFPMGFPIPPMGAMGNFNPAALATHGGAVRGEQGAGNPNGNAGITLHTPVGPIVLPPDVDPAKDPAIYTNLLPRPGSNDNAWESLIEVTKTSETAKLQHLVDNIENKLVDPNQCVVCHRVLSCKSALQMHYRTHTGERPFKCKICGRAFTTKGNLKTHMGVHRAKPPARMLHMCPVCHKKFTNGLVLQQHIRLHTGEPTDMTPEQIQAAELREFPHPFPFMGGFHPFLHHGGPFSPLNSIPGMTGPSLGPDGGSEKPLSFSLKSDNGGKDGEGREDGDLQTEGSSSEALSPASSTANEMSHANRHAELLAQMSRANEALFKKYQQEFIDANDESVNRSDLISECDSEIGGKLEKDFRNEALPSPDDSKEDIEESLHQQKSSNPRHFSPARSSTPDHSLKAADVKSSNNPMASERSSSSASLLSGPLLNHRSGATESSGRSKGSKQPVTGPLPGHPPLSPLDLTAAGRGPPFFPGGYNILPPGPGALPSSVSPGSALSSLTSAVMTSPSFNPLNLPISAPGRGNTTCNICFKTFACHSALEIHYRSHTKERPFKCSICDRGFSTKGNMKQHMMTHKNRDGTPISADVLKSLERSRPNNSFRDAGNSKSNSSDDNNVNDDSHKDGHSSSASSSVSPPKEHCLSLTIQHSRDGATLPLKAISPIDASAANCNGTSSLLSANRSSSSSASFRSSAANKKRSAGLPKHLCHTCDKNFSSSSSLQIHMRTHTGDRPFQCPVCAKAFTTRGNLKVHMGTHSATSINSNGASSNIRSSSSRRGRRMSVDLLTTTNWTMMASKVPPHPAPRPASPSNPANSGACHRPSRPGYPVPFAPALHHLSAFTGLRQPGLLFPSHLVPAYLNAASASEENLAAAYREVNSMSSLSYLNGDLTKNEAATTSGSSNQRRRRENDDEDVEQPGRDSPSRIVIASTPPTSQPWMWHPMDLNKRQVERTDVEADDTDTETDRKDSPAFSTTPPRCEVIRAK